MTETVLQRSLNAVARRLYKLRVLRRQALCWVLLLVPAVVLAMLLPQVQGFVSTNMLVLLGVTIFGLALARWKVPAPTAVETAQLVEKNRPELNDAVLTAVRASAASSTQANPSVLNDWVLDEADKLARDSDWRSVVPGKQMLLWSTLSFLAFGFLITGVVAAGRWGREIVTPASMLEAGATGAPKELIGQTELIVDPGDIEMERGSALTVVARFGKVLPTDVVLQLTTEEGAATFGMEPTVDEGVFAARVNSVNSDAGYRVFFGNSLPEVSALISGPAHSGRQTPPGSGLSQSYNVSTYVRPRLEQVDALITPPAYTKKDPQLIEDTLRITTVEGSMIQLQLHLNKKVAVAELRAKDDSVIPLVSMTPDSNQVVAELEAIDDQKFEVYLEDADGRTAVEQETISLRVTRNKRPKIKVTFPGRDTNVSPLQEFHVEAEATDDFGFSDFGLMYSVTGGGPVEVSLSKDGAVVENAVAVERAKRSPTKVTLQHMIEMEQLKVGPDELLSYYFYVDDTAADGTARRTYSDMMFAEVRRYEEIFREAEQPGGEPPPEQEQQEGNETEKLMQLQRQIMIATWNIQRTLDEGRSREKARDKAAEDATVILESQQQAVELLQDAKEKAADDPDMLKIAEGIERDMNKAIESLTSFTTEKLGFMLQDALFAEQSAFSGLMRMRAKEHEVSQSQSKGKGKGQNSASQQQLNSLELDNERNRYESEKQAQEQQAQNAEQKQQLQILNRLKELARRQEMLNERLKQLESELRAAQTKEEKEEIERELKRLREEQREMLRDVDELRETMDQQSTEQQQKNQETREQVEEARERVQQASQAMDEGKLQEAISEGTRAERQFEELQEEFRNQTSNQFSEAMRDLREQTRQISERQEDIARELSGETPNDESQDGGKAPSLRNERDRQSVQDKLAQQRDELERVLEQAKQIVEEAEESEPLLSRRLYDTVREARETKAQEALEATEILVGRGLWNQGQQAEQVARKGIDELAKGIEKAADAVLGSQAESLQRAQDEIEDLANQLSSEIAEKTGDNPNGDQTDQQQTGDSQQQSDGQQRKGVQRAAAPLPQKPQQTQGQANSEAQPDEQPSRQQGERKPGGSGEGEPSEPQDSERQPGEGQSEKEQRQGEGEGQQGKGEGQQPENEGKESQSEGQGQGSQSGEKGEGQRPGQGQPSGAPSQQSGQQSGQGEGQQPGQANQGSGQGQQSGQNDSKGGGSFLMNGGRQPTGNPGASQARPLTGDEFRDWSNRLREVEEILEDPELRNQLAQVRDRARSIRAEFRRHGTEPKWDLVKSQLLDEMTSLQKRIKQELSKMNSDRAMVPIDREPVPEEFDELVRRYYELLGQSREEAE